MRHEGWETAKRTERRAVPKPGRVPLGDWLAYSQDEGLS